MRLRVTDGPGATSVGAVVVNAGNNSPPVPVINTPGSAFTWRVGDLVSFSGSATDPQDGTLPGVVALVGARHEPLPVELPRAPDPVLRERGERLVQHARSRVSVAPRAPSHGHGLGRCVHHDERAPQPADGRPLVRVEPGRPRDRGERDLGAGAVHAHGHRRLGEHGERRLAAVARRQRLHVPQLVRRRRGDALAHGGREPGVLHGQLRRLGSGPGGGLRIRGTERRRGRGQLRHREQRDARRTPRARPRAGSGARSPSTDRTRG